MCIALPPVLAQPLEPGAEAVFLPRFPRYVQWPAAAAPERAAPYQLCIVGHDPFGPLVDRGAAGETIDGHGVAVRRMAAPEADATCHVAYVQGGSEEETATFLHAFHGRPVLTVTDARAGARRGMVHFTISGGRVRFFIDEAQARAHGLTVSSRLLALAIGVRQRRR